MSYETRFWTEFAAADGFTYTVNLNRRGYTGSKNWFWAAGEPLVYKLGESGPTVPFLNTGAFELRLIPEKDKRLRETLHPDPKAWQMVVQREGTEIWDGYITSEKFGSAPMDNGSVATITAQDGIGTLKEKPYQYAVDNSGNRSFLQQIADQLDTLEGGFPLHVLTNWYPWRQGAQLTGEVLAQLYLDLNVWKHDKSANMTVGRHSILNQIAVGFGLEVFRGFGGWHAVQPPELVFSGRDVQKYDATGTKTGSEDPKVLDTEPWALAKNERTGRTRHAHVASTYDVYPEPENVLLNGSFEPDDPDASTPSWDNVLDTWTFYENTLYRDRGDGVAWGGVPDSQKDQKADFPDPSNHDGEIWYATDEDQHYKSDGSTWNTIGIEDTFLSIQERGTLMGGGSSGDNYALAFRYLDDTDFEGDEGGRVVAETQTDFVASGYPMGLRFNMESWVDESIVDADIGVNEVRVQVNGGEYAIAYAQGQVGSIASYSGDSNPYVLPGAERAMPTDLGTFGWPEEMEEGQPVVPEGAKVPFMNAAAALDKPFEDVFETTRPFRVGDSVIYVEASAKVTLEGIPRLFIPFFAPKSYGNENEASKFGTWTGPGVNTSVAWDTYLPPVDVETVSVQLFNDGSLDGDEFGYAMDNFEIAFTLNGKEIEEFTWSAQTGREGRKMEHPPVRFGDGPQSFSDGAVRFANGDSTLVDDAQGWKRGPWSDSDTPNERTLAQMRSVERLRTRTSGTEELRLQFILREGQEWSPESVLQFENVDGDTLRLWRRSVEWQIRSGILEIPTFGLYQNPDGPIYTTISSVQ